MLPISTTRVSVLRRADASEVDAEYRTETEFVPILTDVRGVLSRPSGRFNFSSSGSTTDATHRLLSDPADIQAGDIILDAADGQKYRVEWAEQRRELIPHTVASLAQTERLS